MLNEELKLIFTFQLIIPRSYQYLQSNKYFFYDKGTHIKRISDWRTGHYFDTNMKKIETLYADFQFSDGHTSTFRIDDNEILPITEFEQISFDF